MGRDLQNPFDSWPEAIGLLSNAATGLATIKSKWNDGMVHPGEMFRANRQPNRVHGSLDMRLWGNARTAWLAHRRIPRDVVRRRCGPDRVASVAAPRQSAQIVEMDQGKRRRL